MSPIAGGPSPPSEAVKRAYPVRRADRIRDDVKRIMNDDRCVRVTNLSMEAREHHLVDLFRIFGFVTHVYIPVDENGSSRGVGYVKFAHRREAESS
jgi:RNA recognition motif-containing protein